MIKQRYLSLKIDSDLFMIVDLNSHDKKQVAQCRTEEYAILVEQALNNFEKLADIK